MWPRLRKGGTADSTCYSAIRRRVAAALVVCTYIRLDNTHTYTIRTTTDCVDLEILSADDYKAKHMPTGDCGA